MDPIALAALDAYNTTMKVLLAAMEGQTAEQKAAFWALVLKREQWWQGVFDKIGGIFHHEPAA